MIPPSRFFSVFAVLLVFLSFALSEEDVLILVSPHWDGVQKEFTQAFQRHYQQVHGHSIDLRWRDIGGTSQIEKAVNALYSKNPESCRIDLFWGGGMDPYENQKNQGHLLSSFPSPEILRSFPQNINGVPLQDPEGYYYATALSTFGIFENVRLSRLKKLPEVKNWSDLARPEFNGLVALVDPRKSGSAHMLYEVILQAYGWEKGWATLIGMVANARTLSQNSSAATKEVALGNVTHALSIDMNAFAIQSVLGSEEVRYIFPSDQSLMVPDGIGIFKGAPHPEAAREFVNFVLSLQGQSLWVKAIGEEGGPSRYGIGRTSILPSLQKEGSPWNQAPSFAYNSKLASQRWTALNELLGRTLIDLHEPLQKAWLKIALQPSKSSARSLFLTPVVTEQELETSYPQWKSDRLVAEKMGEEWSRQAQNRYNTLLP